MLGTFRLILALGVAASHADFKIQGLNPGVTAVVGFYLISGYVMAGLLRRHYPGAGSAAAFYGDRALRLMPQYLCYALLTVLYWVFLTPSAVHPSQAYFLGRTPGLQDILNNLLVIPLNYYMWNGAERFTLIPPAWSLGAEIQFYLIAPFILLWPRRILLAGAIGLAVYLLALLGQINSDWYGYRLLPGVLTFFMLGALLHELHARRHSRHPATALVALVILGGALAGWLSLRQGALAQPYNRETLLGLLIAFPLLHLLARRARRPWDEVAGDISYGVFLNHFLILWMLYPGGVSAAALPGFLLLSIALSFITQRYVERPLLAWRRRLRRLPAVVEAA